MCFAISLILGLLTAGCAPQLKLKQAAGAGNTDLVRNLLDQGHDINQTGGFPISFTPLMYAAREGHIDTVKLLVSKGADINAETAEGLTALGLAARNKRIDVVKFLIDKGASRKKAIEGLKYYDRFMMGMDTLNQPAIEMIGGYR
jgi:ankyrin repeat protein